MPEPRVARLLVLLFIFFHLPSFFFFSRSSTAFWTCAPGAANHALSHATASSTPSVPLPPSLSALPVSLSVISNPIHDIRSATACVQDCLSCLLSSSVPDCRSSTPSTATLSSTGSPTGPPRGDPRGEPTGEAVGELVGDRFKPAFPAGFFLALAFTFTLATLSAAPAAAEFGSASGSLVRCSPFFSLFAFACAVFFFFALHLLLALRLVLTFCVYIESPAFFAVNKPDMLPPLLPSLPLLPLRSCFAATFVSAISAPCSFSLALLQAAVELLVENLVSNNQYI